MIPKNVRKLVKTCESEYQKLLKEPRLRNLLLTVAPEHVLVGGCVRDWYLGNEPKDIDIVVKLSPEKLEAALAQLTVGPFPLTVTKKTSSKKTGWKIKRSHNLPEIDIWSLDVVEWPNDRPMIKSLNGVHLSFFTTIESIIYNPRTQTIKHHLFFENLDAKTIDAVFLPESFPDKQLCILRTIRFCKRYKLTPTATMTELITEGDWHYLDTLQTKLLVNDKIAKKDLEDFKTVNKTWLSLVGNSVVGAVNVLAAAKPGAFSFTAPVTLFPGDTLTLKYAEQPQLPENIAELSIDDEKIPF